MPIITSTYAAVFTLYYIGLSLNVIRLRRSQGVPVMDAGADDTLKRAIRVHGNFAEYVPLALILMALCELMQGAGWILHTAGLGVMVSRVLHAYSLMVVEPRRRRYHVRVVAMVTMFTVLGSLAALLLFQAL